MNEPYSSDRELLTDAAAAAGIDLRWIEAQTDEHGFVLPGCEPWCYEHITPPPPHNRRKGDSHGNIWNPLDDGNDALRLAVKLGLSIHIVYEEWDGRAPTTYVASGEPHFIEIFELHNGDADAATRRAIVRAAAEIWRKR